MVVLSLYIYHIIFKYFLGKYILTYCHYLFLKWKKVEKSGSKESVFVVLIAELLDRLYELPY